MAIIKLTSNDGESFEVDQEVAKKSEVIREMLENCDDCSESVPLPNISSSQLEKVVEWMNRHKDDVLNYKNEEKDYTSDNIPEWDKKFFQLSQTELFDLILAANYLDIKDMLDLLAKSVANMMNGKTAHEIRVMFEIECDLSDEEIKRIQNENEWDLVSDN